MRMNWLAAACGLWATASLAIPVRAADVAKVDVAKVHGISLVGPLALPPDYQAFPWVNPDAPKGGEVALAATGTFDSFNPFIVRGTPGPVTPVWDTLMQANPNELSSEYGRLAQTVELPADKSWVAFDLRPEARWWDGKPVTAEDVAWTFDTLRASGRPFYTQYYGGVDHVEVDGPGRVVFRFKTAGNRELPSIIGQLPVLPKHWWAGRDFSAPLTEPPLGSGPYRVGHFEFGHSITMERVPNYWGRNLPFARGLYNFDKIRTEYFRDTDVQFEAFKAGQVDWRQELSGKAWATRYDFPAIARGSVKKEALQQHLPTGMQGFAMNLRRPQFRDRRVREAMAQLFDFDWINKTLSYGLNERIESYFAGTEFATSGLPAGDELALLNQYRGQVPPEVFTTAFHIPATDGSGNNPQGLRRAYDLLKAAGYVLRDRKLVGPDGKQLSFEILDYDPTFQRLELPYSQQLERLGIAVQIRTVDPAQYQHRMDSFDYDMTTIVVPGTDSPGNEEVDNWGCASGKQDGGSNIVGVCDPVVDALARKVVEAPDKAALLTATHALDRVLLWNWYVVPQFRRSKLFIAYWDRFGRPAQPIRTGTEFDSWWFDTERAKADDLARKHGG